MTIATKIIITLHSFVSSAPQLAWHVDHTFSRTRKTNNLRPVRSQIALQAQQASSSTNTFCAFQNLRLVVDYTEYRSNTEYWSNTEYALISCIDCFHTCGPSHLRCVFAQKEILESSQDVLVVRWGIGRRCKLFLQSAWLDADCDWKKQRLVATSGVSVRIPSVDAHVVVSQQHTAYDSMLWAKLTLSITKAIAQNRIVFLSSIIYFAVYPCLPTFCVGHCL